MPSLGDAGRSYEGSPRNLSCSVFWCGVQKMRNSKIALLRDAIENTKQIQAIASDLPRIWHDERALVRRCLAVRRLL